MKSTPITLLGLILASFVGAKTAVADPIDNLVKKVNASYGLFLNGSVPSISLPPDAKPNEVIAEAVKRYGSSNLPEGFIKNYQIREVRQVKINNELETYSAALVQSDFGTYVWLFRPLKENQWWVRFYAVPNDELQNALATLQNKLHGAWKGAGPCDGRLVLEADGSYQREHFSPGNNSLKGTWTVRWDSLPPTLVLTCVNSDDPDHVGKTTEVKLLQLNDESLTYEFFDQTPARYTRLKK